MSDMTFTIGIRNENLDFSANNDANIMEESLEGIRESEAELIKSNSCPPTSHSMKKSVSFHSVITVHNYLNSITHKNSKTVTFQLEISQIYGLFQIEPALKSLLMIFGTTIMSLKLCGSMHIKSS